MRFIEAADKTGKIWDIVIIEEGLSGNGVNYPFEVLKEAKDLYEGAPVKCYGFKGAHLDHLPDTIKDTLEVIGKTVTQNIVGFLKNVKAGKLPDSDKRGLTARFHITASGDWLAKTMKEAFDEGIKDFLGFSHDVKGEMKATVKDGNYIKEAISIKRVDSVDVVTRPAAGGRYLRLVASLQKNITEGNQLMKEKFTAALQGLLKSINEKLTEGIDFAALSSTDAAALINKAEAAIESSNLAQTTLKAALKDLSKLVAGDKLEEATAYIGKLTAGESTQITKAAPEPAPEPATEGLKNIPAHMQESAKKYLDDFKAEIDKKKAEVETVIARQKMTAVVEKRLTESQLPVQSISHLRETFIASDKVLTEAEIDAQIKKHRDYIASLPGFKESGQPPMVGRITVGADAKDLMIVALDGFWDGKDLSMKNTKGELQTVKRFMTLQEAYRAFSGKSFNNNFQAVRSFLTDASFYIPKDYREGKTDPYGQVSQDLVDRIQSMKESLKTSDWAEILGDSVTRKMQKDYLLSGYGDWRKLVSDIVPLTSTRTQRRMIMGGYANLSTVAEQGTYPVLTSPTDTEATYAPAKKGGLDSITEEMLLNDDVGAMRKIPSRLGIAAARTLYTNIFDMLKNNLEQDGATAIASTARANYETTALSAAEMTVIRQMMREQTGYGGFDVLGEANLPRFLIVPAELEELAYKLQNSMAYVNAATGYSTGAALEGATTPNIHKGIEPIIVAEWTDATDYWVAADPAKVPMIEVGFMGGKEEPELFVQDNPLNGSMFTADKITYKIRHWYGYGIMDYRGLVYSHQ